MRLINADALYETLCHIWDRTDSEDFEKAVFREIENAPTVEERKTGKWIAIGQKQKHGYEWMRCSECGKEEAPIWEAETYYYGDGQHSYTLYRCPVCHARYMSPTDYCPHCGKPLNRTEG